MALVNFNLLINDLKMEKIEPPMEWRERMREENKIIVKNKLKIKRKARGRMNFITQKDKSCGILGKYK